MSTLSMTRGDTRQFILTVVLSCKPFDITGCALVFTATSTTPRARIQLATTDGSVVLTTPASGLATMTVAPAVTNALPDVLINFTYKWVMTDTLGNVSTIETGTFTVLP